MGDNLHNSSCLCRLCKDENNELKGTTNMENKKGEANYWIKPNMTKELAERIVNINIEEAWLSNEKYEIRNKVTSNGSGTWENVCTEAMKFLIENQKGGK